MRNKYVGSCWFCGCTVAAGKGWLRKRVGFAKFRVTCEDHKDVRFPD